MARWVLDAAGCAAGGLRLAGPGLLALGVAIDAGGLGKRGQWWLWGIAAVGAMVLVWSG